MRPHLVRSSCVSLAIPVARTEPTPLRALALNRTATTTIFCMWVDTHCHLQLLDVDPDALLDRADKVDWVVAPGVDLDSSVAALALSRRRTDVLASAGLHPHDAEHWPSQVDGIAALLPNVSAVGETGLDYYRNLAPQDKQRQSFGAQIDLAIEFDLPLIVHCRDAFADVHAMLEKYAAGPRAVLHCWTGGTRWTKRFLELGVMFSFAGPVAFETGETIRLGAALVPPERALVETDTPYLSPPPHRGEHNEPAHVQYVGQTLAKVWSLDVAEVARQTSENARTVFHS
jgi:TatD DNase family protein